MQDRHADRLQYFKEQSYTTKQFVIPYIESIKSISATSKILEIGCGEGGNMIPFIELGCKITGVDINSSQIENAKVYLKEVTSTNTYDLIAKDIYKVTVEDIGTFDLIFLRDVIEHIPNQERFMAHVKQFLQPDGVIFFGFPPWYMPFGGHQQIVPGFISKLPYIHLLPNFIYKFLLKLSGFAQSGISELLDIKKTGISIERFRKIVKQNGFTICKETLYLINPNYEIKFKLKTKEQYQLISRIPFVRNFLTTCCYTIISKNNNNV